MPKSDRLIVAVPVNPATTALLRIWSGAMRLNVTLSVTGFVTPSIVRLPMTSADLAPVVFTSVLLKVIVGNFSTLKKPADCRSLSRAASPVSTLAVPIVTVTLLLAGALSSSRRWPLILLEVPVIVEKPRWLIVKIVCVCIGSTAKESAAKAEAGIATVARSAVANSDFERCFIVVIFGLRDRKS